MKKIYLIPGLGADERVFAHLDLSGCEPVFIQWIPPLKNESIAAYALRLTEQVHDDDPVLLGVSFGGMIAVEMAKILPAEKVILVSSAKTSAEIPWYFRFAGKLQLDRLLPSSLLKHPGFLANWFFGAATPGEKQLLKNILHDTDPVFLKWALRAILHWQNSYIPPNMLHIHGTKDRLLPFRNHRSLVPVEGGGHLMILNKAGEISGLLTAF